MRLDFTRYHDTITSLRGGYLICLPPPSPLNGRLWWFGFIYEGKVYNLGWETSSKIQIELFIESERDVTSSELNGLTQARGMELQNIILQLHHISPDVLLILNYS
jgi:hypothetical protein